MDCPQTEFLSNREYIEIFQRRVNEQRVPLTGSIDLTHRCNLRCIHCYLPRKGKETSGRAELNASQWKRLLDEVAAAGCLFLLFTGGEPLLRPDFTEIYLHAKQNGLLATIFTNGTLVSDEHVALLAESPPYRVEISLYGATRATYESITGVPGSFDTCIAGIHRLLDNDILVGLKTVLMKPNLDEFQRMRTMAADLGVKWRSDAGIFPRFDGDRAPLELRVEPKVAVDLEMADDGIVDSWRKFWQRAEGQQPPADPRLYQCGAGIRTFHVDAYGRLQPCLMTPHISADVSAGGFEKAWRNDIAAIQERRIQAGNVCGQCEKKEFCGYCPAFMLLETGDENGYSKHCCEIGKHRYETIVQTTRQR